MKSLALFVALVTLPVSAAPQKSNGKPHGHALKEYFNPEMKIYVGCRPSLGECFNSCPDHRATAEIDRDRCDPDSVFERFACYCLFQGET